MKKNSTTPSYDPKLPNQVWLEREAGHSHVPKNGAERPGNYDAK
jgi:hypothetical protein